MGRKEVRLPRNNVSIAVLRLVELAGGFMDRAQIVNDFDRLGDQSSGNIESMGGFVEKAELARDPRSSEIRTGVCRLFVSYPAQNDDRIVEVPLLDRCIGFI